METAEEVEFLKGEISSLSDNQEMILSVLRLVSGVLSILGSSTIVYRVYKNRKTSKPYDRIMLGLSCFDIIASFTFAASPFLVPEETSQRVWAIGNETSCSFLGFLTQLSFAAVWYNGMLSYYYLATLKYNVKTPVFATRYEPYIHISTAFFFLFTATGGLPFNLYSEFELTQGCWIAEYPEGCEASDDCIGNYIAWVFGGLPVLFTFISLIANHLAIYYHVKKTLRIGNTHTPEQIVHIERVATQGGLYVVTFLISYTPGFTIRILESIGYDASDEADIFVLLVLNALLLPLQGFFNMFVYTRPIYQRLKMVYPDRSNFWAIKQACMDSEIPRYEPSRSFTTSHSEAKPPVRQAEHPPLGESRLSPKPMRRESLSIAEIESKESNYEDTTERSMGFPSSWMTLEDKKVPLKSALKTKGSGRSAKRMRISFDGSIREI